MRRLSCAILCSIFGAAPSPAQTPDHETTRIAEGVYQFRYDFHNALFVVTDEGVVAFDPISKEAAAIYAQEIQRVAPNVPLRAIVYSHHHADHITGAPVLAAPFGGKVRIIAHENAYAKLAAEPNPDLPPPDETFSDTMTIQLGSRALELHYVGKSHSDNLIVGHLPESKIVFAVDFVSNDAVGYRDLSEHHFPEFFEALRRLQAIDYETIIFGHGRPGDRATVDRQIQYYNDLRSAVRRAFYGGASEGEAAARVQLPEYRDWRGYDDWFKMNVRAIYRWVVREGGAERGQ